MNSSARPATPIRDIDDAGTQRRSRNPELIDQTTATRNPFDKKYSKVEDAAWETCASVLNPISVRELMEAGWG